MTVDERPKSSLTAWERWELASFDTGGEPAANAATPPDVPAVDPEEVARIREEARRAGHEAGFAAGQAEAESLVREQARRLAQAADRLEQGIRELDQTVAADLVALSVEVARQVVRHELATKPERVLGVVREALEQLPMLHAAIHLNPEDASLVRLRAGDQLAHAGHRIHEDAKLSRGDVVIEAGGSHLDASLAVRWRRVVEALGQNAPWLAPGDES